MPEDSFTRVGVLFHRRSEIRYIRYDTEGLLMSERCYYWSTVTLSTLVLLAQNLVSSDYSRRGEL